MLDLFRSLVGSLGSASDLEVVLACLFYLFVLSEIFRFLEMFFDFVFRRKK